MVHELQEIEGFRLEQEKKKQSDPEAWERERLK